METAVPVTVPKALDCVFTFGDPQTGWFKMLNASKRNCNSVPLRVGHVELFVRREVEREIFRGPISGVAADIAESARRLAGESGGVPPARGHRDRPGTALTPVAFGRSNNPRRCRSDRAANVRS